MYHFKMLFFCIAQNLGLIVRKYFQNSCAGEQYAVLGSSHNTIPQHNKLLTRAKYFSFFLVTSQIQLVFRHVGQVSTHIYIIYCSIKSFLHLTPTNSLKIIFWRHTTDILMTFPSKQKYVLEFVIFGYDKLLTFQNFEKKIISYSF